MSESIDCPTERQLLELAEGRLEPSVAASLTAHVQGCERCTPLLDWVKRRLLQPSDKDSGAPKSTPSAGTTDGNQVATHEPLSLTRPEGTLDEATFDVDLLTPSENRESIGRLGKYDVLGVLGHGGMGVVFRAYDEQLRRKVALKLMNRSLNSSATARRRFIREARAAAAINHPNVVTIHAVEEHKGMPFLVMEFVNGPSLRDRLRAQNTLDPIAAVRVSAQIALGLAAAHAQGVIHRDIKPGNIMLEDGLERVKITDFGLARAAIDNVELTSRELAVGTPAYMAPEQVNGHDADPRSDLFSLGCVMYATIAGHSPFHGKHALEMARRVTDYNPEPLTKLCPRVPQFYSDIAARLLEKDPEKRFQSAQEVADLLNRHLSLINQANSATLSQVLHAPLRVGRRVTRQQIGWIASAAVVALGVTGLASWAWFKDRDRSPTPPSVTSGGGPIAPVEPPLTGTITVAKSLDAQFKSIADALNRAGPGARIEVLDAEEYDEPIVIDDSDRLGGVQIVSSHRATLTAPTPQSVVQLTSTPGVVLSGFRMIVHRAQHGIEITGASAGVRIEDLQVTRVDRLTGQASRGSDVAFLYLRSGAAGSNEAPIELRNLDVQGGRVGIVIGEQNGVANESTAVRWVRVENCRLLGPKLGEGYMLIFFNICDHVVVTRNIFGIGDCGINFDGMNRARYGRDVSITHNTFYSLTHLLLANDLAPEQDVKFHSNLILETKGAVVPELELTATAEKWFAKNWWEARPDIEVRLAGKMAELAGSVPVMSTDPQSPDFLRPNVAELAKHMKPGEEIPGRFGEENISLRGQP